MAPVGFEDDASPPSPSDRKSTRLNSSHSQISYAVFCLKKKNTPFSSVGVACAAAKLGKSLAHIGSPYAGTVTGLAASVAVLVQSRLNHLLLGRNGIVAL